MFLWQVLPFIGQDDAVSVRLESKRRQGWRIARGTRVVTLRCVAPVHSARKGAPLAWGQPQPQQASLLLTRRVMIQSWFMAAVGMLFTSPAAAEQAQVEETALPRDVRNLLELYVDLQRGYKMYRPKGWNEFDGDPGNTKYEKKFQDIIQPLEFVTVYSIPVKPGKTLESLGDAEAVGRRLAEKRGATLVAANQKESNGVLYYIFEYVREPVHQLSLITINRGRLFSVNASASEARWKRLEKLLRAVVDSFVPQL
ncbi:hypothetical protein CCYA_CCYA08G2270 [Cyanidiococcus yangmingshanensis]|nr:hypothetical protein CCYA_CCYA08G2270 [Cyanidiococcus yangmingshanensis]